MTALAQETTAAGGDLRRPRGRSAVAVSVVVPVTERSDDLAKLYDEFCGPLQEAVGDAFEFVFVAEPWFQDRMEPLRTLAEQGAPIRVLKTGQAVGETSLVRFAANRCRGRTILTLPAYRRVDASVLPALVFTVEAGADLVVARRWPRRDGILNRLQSGAFNLLTSRLADGRVHDIGCGVRAIRRSVLLDLPLYGDFIRYLPILAIREGYDVEELPAPQHPDDRHTRLHSPGVYLRRLIDLLGLFFLIRFTEKPLRFFGMFGAVSSLAGAAALLLVGLQRIFGQPIADRPLLLLGVLLVVVGVQAIALGLVGEIIVHLHAPDRRPYRIDRQSLHGPT